MMRLLRLLVSIPLAFVIVTGLSSLGIVASCGTNGDFSHCTGPPPPPPCTPTWRDTTNASDTWTIDISDHQYEDDFTVQGYRTDVGCNGGTYSIDSITANSLGQEMCPPTLPQTDWDKTESSPAPIDPWTLTGIGGYASDPFDCSVLGHWVTASGSATMVDSLTGLNESGVGGFYHCFVLAEPPDGPPPGC